MHIKVSVTAEAKRESFKKVKNDSFTLCVREPAERNMANKKVIELLCKHFGTGARIKLIKGHHSPSKIFSVETK